MYVAGVIGFVQDEDVVEDGEYLLASCTEEAVQVSLFNCTGL